MFRYFLPILLFILLLLPSTWASAQNNVAVLEAGRSKIELSPYVTYSHDATSLNDQTQMFDLAKANKFKRLPNGNATFGFSKGTYWFHTYLFNQDSTEQRWLLVLQYPLLDYVDVYVRYPDNHVEHFTSGDMQPFSARAIRYRQPNFWIDLPQKTQVELLVSASSKSSIQAPLAIYTPSAFAEMERDAQFGIGIYNGILFALFCYNLILWLILRDQNHFWYMMHISGFGLVLFCLNGLSFEYIWPNNPWLANHAIPLSMCFSQLAMHQFARLFLNMKETSPFANRVAYGFIAFYSLMGIASLFIDYATAVTVTTKTVFPGIIFVLTMAFIAIRKGYRPARLFLVAWAALLIGTFIYASVSFGILPKVFITEYGIQIGSAIEMILLSFALAYRYANLRNENVKIVYEANEKLESNVAKRTSELSLALEQLADANKRLRESSQRDALTGLYNRRHFREMFEQMLRQTTEQRQPLGLMLIDLDYFKKINDTYGHLAGDECLRSLSKTITLTLTGHNAIVGRFGGEEFVVIVPNVTLEKLSVIAEELRSRIEKENISIGKQSITITASLGIISFGSDKNLSPDQALHQADEALYVSKNKGRNRVSIARESIPF
jgi:two-component system, sensor histidine kinase LadS